MKFVCMNVLVVLVLVSNVLGYNEDSNQLSTRILSRRRRFLTPTGTGITLTFRFRLDIPLEIGSFVRLEIPFVYSFDSGSVSGRRSLESRETSRWKLIEGMEDVLHRFSDQIGLKRNDSPHECVLRALCEMSETPIHADGLLGDGLHLLQTPPHLLDSVAMPANDYLRAQINGRHHGNCSDYHRLCETSFFEIRNGLPRNLYHFHDDPRV